MPLLTEENRQAVLSRLHTIVGERTFETWCRSLRFDEVGQDSVQVPLPNPFYREWVERELRAPIEEAFRLVFGRAPSIAFTVGAGIDAASFPSPFASTAAPASRPAPPTGAPFPLNSECTFSRFVVGPTNRMAHAAAVSVSENPGRFANPFFVHGASGLGKTHLLQAICHAILERNPHARILYLTCENFVNDFVGAVMRKNFEPFRSRYRNLDVLLVDDIHFLADKEGSQEEFFHTFNALHAARKQMIFSSDAAPKHIPTLEERLTSRFEMGFVARVDAPTFEMRLAILRQRSEEKGHPIPDDVLSYVASSIQTNIRELEGAVNKVLASAALTHRRVDVELAREALQGIAGPADRTLSPEDVIQAVAKHYGKKLSEFKTRRWTKSTSLARHVAIYLTKHLTPLSLVEIGEAFGGKDHSTVLYALKRVELRMSSDPDFSREIERLGRGLHRG